MAEKTEKFSLFFKSASALALLGLMLYALVIIVSGLLKSFATGITIFETIRGDILIVTGLPIYFAAIFIIKIVDKFMPQPVPEPIVKPAPEILDIPEASLLPDFQNYQNAPSSQASANSILTFQIAQSHIKRISGQLAKVAACTKSKDLKRERTILLEYVNTAFSDMCQDRPPLQAVALIERLCHALLTLPLEAINRYKHWQNERSILLGFCRIYTDDSIRLAKLKDIISLYTPEDDIVWILEEINAQRCLKAEQAEIREIWATFCKNKSRCTDKLWSMEQMLDLRKQLLRWRYAKDVRDVPPPLVALAGIMDIAGPLNPSDVERFKTLFNSLFFRQPSYQEVAKITMLIDIEAPPAIRQKRHKVLRHPQDRIPENEKKKGKKTKSRSKPNNPARKYNP